MSDRRSVSLAADRRARVPFALIGVLLLVSSGAYAGGLATSGQLSEDQQVERAIEGANAATTPAMRQAVASAARDAAREPVTRPAEGVAGDLIREESAFEDALEVRIALAVEQALTATKTRRGSVTAETGTPAITSSDDLISARERVSVRPVANGTALEVTHRNVTTTATRNGRVRSRRSRSVTVVVPVPVLAAHERTEQFDRRLDRDPIEGPGLGRQLTASLYPITWARGYAQYGGVPVQNVLANRHVELSTNAAIAREQRAVFGTSDPGTVAGVRRATARTGLTDLLAPTDLDEQRWTNAVIDEPTSGTDLPADPETPAESRTVSIDRSADAAFLDTLDDLDTVTRDAYRVDASLSATVTEINETQETPAPREPPGENWTLVAESVMTSTGVADGEDTDGYRPAGTDVTTGFGTATRWVSVHHEVRRLWTNGVDRRRTQASWVERYRVDVAVDGSYAPRAGAPNRPTSPTFDGGGWADGPNLRDAPHSARLELGGDDVDAVAREAVETGGIERKTTVVAERPASLDALIRADLAALRDELQTTETSVDMQRVAAGDADPYGELAAAIQTRRGELIDSPATYDGASDRARVAARTVYVDAIIAELETQSGADADTRAGIDDTADTGGVGDAAISKYTEAKDAAQRPKPYTLGADGPGGDVEFTPRGAPGYLPRTAVSSSDVDAVPVDRRVRPLATRNVNYVTVPTTEIASGIVSRLLGDSDTVRLSQGGRALIAAERALAADDDPALRADRDALATNVADSTLAVEEAVAVTLRTETHLGESERQAVLAAASNRWDGTGPLAVAMGNGSYATAVADETAARTDLSPGERAVLESRLRIRTASVADTDAVRVPAELTNDTATAAREVARAELEAEVSGQVDAASSSIQDRWAPKAIRSVSAGLPVTPVPGYWYATLNVWRVDVAGEYPRFELYANTGPPGEQFRYVRESSRVTVDVGNETVLLGHTDPVSFETGTVVVVAVPPGTPGVGDVDGVRDETSPSWPCPGPVDEDCSQDDAAGSVSDRISRASNRGRSGIP